MDTGLETEVALLDGKVLYIPRYGFYFAAAKAIHRNLVRIPLWCVLDCLEASPEWLRPYVVGKCILGIVDTPYPGRPGRAVRIDGAMQNAQSGLYYREDLGIVIAGKVAGEQPDPIREEDWDDESCD
jgi:hypothetical protein